MPYAFRRARERSALTVESFSQVIKRVVKKPVDVQQFLKRIGEQPLSAEAAAAIETHLKRRRPSGPRR